MRGCWLLRTSASSEQEIAGIRIVTEGRTGLSAEKKAVQQTIVATRREDVRDDHREQGDRGRDKAVVRTFTHSLVVRSLSQRQIRKVSTNRTCSTQRVTQLHTERRSDCVWPERNCNVRQQREVSTRQVTTVVNVRRRTDQTSSEN